MAMKQENQTVQAWARGNMSLDSTHGGHKEHYLGSHVGGCGNVVPIIVEFCGISRLSLLMNLKTFSF